MPPGAGKDREIGDLRQAERRGFRREAEVARHTELDADTEAVRLRGEDDGLLDLFDLVEQVVMGFRSVLATDVRAADHTVGALTDVGAQARKVEPRREVPPLTGDHQHAEIVAVAEIPEGVGEQFEHLRRDRVHLLVAGERHRDDAFDILAPCVARAHSILPRRPECDANARAHFKSVSAVGPVSGWTIVV